MNTHNFVLGMTTGLLAMPPEEVGRVCDYVDGLFGANDQAEGACRITIVMQDKHGLRVPLRNWIHDLHSTKVTSVRLGLEADSGPYPDYKMAGFAGGRPWTLEIIAERGSSQFLLGTTSSPEHAMTSAHLVQLVNQQQDPDFFWEVIEQEINQFHRCNGMPEIDECDLESFLASSEGEQNWKVIGDTLFRELQVEAHVYDEPFTVPDEMAALVNPVVPFFDDLDEQFIDLYTYDDDDVSGNDLLELVEAQDFAGVIWVRCANIHRLIEDLGEDVDFEQFPRLSAEEWPRHLQGIEAGDACHLCDGIIELIKDECTQRSVQPVIPEELDEVFGPDETERRRVYFRIRMQHDLGWQLARNPEPWLAYTFFRRPEEVDLCAPPRLAVAKLEFEAALTATEHFARRVESSFADSFRLALLLSQDTSLDETRGIDTVALRGKLAKQFPSEDTSWIDALFLIVDGFSQFNWEAGKVRALAAISAADVFGAMGSWNDQSFEGEEDAVFEELSRRLYDAMNSYFSALLSQ